MNKSVVSQQKGCQVAGDVNILHDPYSDNLCWAKTFKATLQELIPKADLPCLSILSLPGICLQAEISDSVRML